MRSGPATEPVPRWIGGVEQWRRTHEWASDTLAALALVAVLGALSLSGAQGLHWPTGWVVFLIVAFAVLHVSVAFRVRAPQLAYAAASVALLGIVSMPDARVVNRVADSPTHVPALFLPSSLVFLVLLYSVAARAAVARSRVALATALAGVAIATASAQHALRQFTAGGWLVFFYFAAGLTITVLLTWNLGRLAGARRRRAIVERVESARLAVLEERARIARELHDIIAHALAVIVRQAEGGAFVAESDPQRAGQTLRTIADAGRAALTEMRGLLGVLREPGTGSSVASGAESAGGPGAERHTGSLAAPQPGLAEVSRLVAGLSDTGVVAELVESGVPFGIGAGAELAVYRLAQEGLTNAVKHAGSHARVTVTIAWRPMDLVVEVLDDGGVTVDPTPPPAGHPVPGAGAGLRGLHDRVAAAGGTFSAAACGRGFRIQARFTRSSVAADGTS